MEQHLLTEGLLLDSKGNLNEAGYHTSLIKTYHRNMVKAKGMRIKEWDYYYVGNDHVGVALTVADNSYMWLTSATLFDFDQAKELSWSKMGWFPNGNLNLPETSTQGDVVFKKKNFSFEFRIENGKRYLKAFIKSFNDQKDLSVDLVLEKTIKNSMVIATPFEKPKHFYYNQKINLLKASGKVQFGEQNLDFKDSYGVLDWGRGVWTYKNTWYWSSMSGVYQNHKIGFNLGYGFGDTKNASENMFFYDDEVIKLDDVLFDIPMKDGKEDYLKPWNFTSKDGRINLVFEPILDRHSNSNVLVISSNQHQVFGKFSGSIQVNPKRKIEFKNMMGFAEKVMNKW